MIKIWLGALLALCLLPLVTSPYYVYFFTEVIIWGLFALSYNLLIGHTGMLSFGHATFFGIGAYAYALLIKKAAVPFVVALAAAPVAGLLSGLIIGFFCVRSKRLYFAFLTLAFGQLVYLILFRWYSFTGGEDGIIGVPIPAWLANTTHAYYFALGVTAICLFLLLTITNSAFGAVLHATRDNPERVSFSGMKVMRYQLASFSIAGLFAAVAGALYVTLTKAAFIEYIGMETGILALFACLLGGMHTFYGPLLGTVLIVALDKLVGSYTQHWSAIMGIAVIVVAIGFPKGILGYLKYRMHRSSQREL
jgi:branched-chain amino acid transport system permease protein